MSAVLLSERLRLFTCLAPRRSGQPTLYHNSKVHTVAGAKVEHQLVETPCLYRLENWAVADSSVVQLSSLAQR
jgi:hypothetical protein